MAITPFHYVPKRLFLVRMLRLSVFVFFVGFFLMGAMAQNDQVNLNPLEMARYEYARLPRVFAHPPEVCRRDEFVSDFQRERCGEYRSDLLLTAFWVLFPFLLAGVFLRVAFSTLSSIYQKAETGLRTPKGLFIGKVTDPPEMPNDLFGWGFCLRSITVQLGKNKQLRVYIPQDSEIPSPGSELAIFDLGKKFGRSRYMAAPYMPHVAIVSGNNW